MNGIMTDSTARTSRSMSGRLRATCASSPISAGRIRLESVPTASISRTGGREISGCEKEGNMSPSRGSGSDPIWTYELQIAGLETMGLTTVSSPARTMPIVWPLLVLSRWDESVRWTR